MECLTIKELVLATNGKLIYGDYNDCVSDIVIDSREAKAQNAFVAIVGENLDGHTFIKSAYDSGCKTFIKNKSNGIKLESSDINLIEVKDTTLALGNISRYYKEKFDIPFIGVTGSVGKTTTRDMIYAAISAKLNILKNEKNLNNHFGVPLTLFNLNKEHECAVIEMGMSGFNEIKYLVDIVNPKIAVISNIGLSHIENLGSQEGILKAKLEIASNFDDTNTLIVNGDDKFLSTLKEKEHIYKLKTFGFNKDNDIYCEDYTMEEDSLTFTCVINGKKEEIFIPTIGEHNIYNAMSAILIGMSLNISLDYIKTGLKNFKGTKMRLDIIKNERLIIINDSYNASPDSMEAALKILGRYKGRKVAILGDMLEMGEISEYGHRLVGKSSMNNTDIIITIGENSVFIGDEAKRLGFDSSNIYHFKNRDDVFNQLDELIKTGDTILVKGSRGMKLEKIVEYLNK
ncbi:MULTISPECIES: UDP-N-acetylmuramoyl-tripeptide--D-alanyl-D-alanine ligase [unclassified Clostridioides]|uniref:UDP-N-acetylmuramoyl-tripeptide--D-alanyl-D- alanine ligase n=1 Tax=unclassified Clostridioides TaxID=2635829 RepID=UPI001D11A21A|nr:UDP-N-acetylmuramoyl-tripeptide--D-alanyl-D-alanine ligase [Clostridioides sp. ZZV14-6045]MCC0733069.1 UDP-N-acetylmuramoyl-tripeptide--D-alanyl-D-alanine ligase [Clostridioides sp. ZZV14-6009]MCC0737397.1 UDP-N-acetylmuramoyl-tripeptide--D-alanyl-D-alanine ligase [Clostridioides sp. ZZV14-5902]